MYELSPFSNYRPEYGFGSLFRFLDDASEPIWNTSGANYDLRQLDEQTYELAVSVPGFAESELSVEAKGDVLAVRGEKPLAANDADDADNAKKDDEKPSQATPRYLYRGIGGGRFARQFRLAEHVRVTGAELSQGVLTIRLVRDIPAEDKPQQIKIAAA